MTTPPPSFTKDRVLIALTAGENFTEVPSPCGIEEQSQTARRLAWLLMNAGQELQDAATEVDTATMYEQARMVASRVLAVCPLE